MEHYGGKEYFWKSADCGDNNRYLCEVGMLPYIFSATVNRDAVLKVRSHGAATIAATVLLSIAFHCNKWTCSYDHLWQWMWQWQCK